MKKDVGIMEELAELNANYLKTAGNNNLYALPTGYFDDLAGGIISRIKVESIPAKNVYPAPLNYFETLPEVILDKIHIASIINSATDKSLFSVPENYFDNLSSNILQKIKSKNNIVHQELEEVAPLLNSIPKINVYSAPDGYFENLSPNISLQTKQPAKVVSFKPKPQRWVNYAAAACIAFVLFGGGYLYTHHSTNNYLAQIAGLNVQKEIAQLPDNAISDYLSDDTADVFTQNDDSKQSIDVQNLLENTSDEEIENYLTKNSDPGEITNGM